MMLLTVVVIAILIAVAVPFQHVRLGPAVPKRRMQQLLPAPNLKCWVASAPRTSLAAVHGINTDAKFVFVGGKGGVGKTTSSSAIALSSSARGSRTLIVSTDPAHSLGDALDVDLSSGKVVPLTAEKNLWALEVDVNSALLDFKKTMEGFDSSTIAKSLGISKEMVDSFGVQDMADIFTNPPPGIDEIVALMKIFQHANIAGMGEKNQQQFDRVVIDTAPTGHTLRLLQLPQFLNTLTGKLIKLKMKVTGAIDAFKSFFGGGSAGESTKVSSMLDKLETLQTNIGAVQRTLKDKALTQFIVVTIPTMMAVEESKRLVSSLQGEGISIANVICNQVLSPEIGPEYLRARIASQQKVITTLRADVSALQVSSPTSSSSAAAQAAPIEIQEVPFVASDVTGIEGLRFFHSLAHPNRVDSPTDPTNSRKLTIFGGKGGVGKTTSAASWGLQLADSGLRTLVVSTDPAHSLGDALRTPLSGTPLQIPLSSTTNSDQDRTQGTGEEKEEKGELWALEIDPSKALSDLNASLRQNMAGAAQNAGDEEEGGNFMQMMGLPDLNAELADLMLSLKDPPPGTDEIVALAQVIDYLDNGFTVNGRTVHFDRIVLDTAPTGHTLRMLQLPQFMQKLIVKVRSLREKSSSMSGGNIFGMFGGGEEEEETPVTPTVDENDMLTVLERRMARLEKVLHSPAECEFTAVTIPTELATAETKRLLAALREDNILVRRLIVNQVLSMDGQGLNLSNEKSVLVPDQQSMVYLEGLRRAQTASLTELRDLAHSTGSPLIEVPYFDKELRDTAGLQVMVRSLFPDEVK